MTPIWRRARTDRTPYDKGFAHGHDECTRAPIATRAPNRGI